MVLIGGGIGITPMLDCRTQGSLRNHMTNLRFTLRITCVMWLDCL
jgi:ferredoxin-NADP reductase